MCISTITIPTRSRFVSNTNMQRLITTVNCGHCCECQDNKMRDYQFRLYYEAKDCIDKGGFIYYDTLTYKNSSLPHASDFFDILKNERDFSCFNREHLRLWLVNLRRQLEYYGYDNADSLGYYITTEYGTDERFTHRPHYHILLFVRFKISPLKLSEFVSKTWSHGRTDGCPYKSGSYVLSHNTIKDLSVRLTNYVAKYVKKSSVYQNVIDSRIDFLINKLDRYNMTVKAYNQRVRKIKRTLNQFHLNSKKFGLSFLDYTSPGALISNPYVLLYNATTLPFSMPLPKYYHRHLFERCVKIYGKRYYELNEDGVRFRDVRQRQTYDLMLKRYLAICKTYHLDFPFSLEDVVKYAVYERGFSLGSSDYQFLKDRLGDCSFVYYTDDDFDKYGFRFVREKDGSVHDYKYWCQVNSLYCKAYEDVIDVIERFSNTNSKVKQQFSDEVCRVRELFTW